MFDSIVVSNAPDLLIPVNMCTLQVLQGECVIRVESGAYLRTERLRESP
jgi:hypothetical protein